VNRVSSGPFELVLGLLALLTLAAVAATTPALGRGVSGALPWLVGLAFLPDFVDLVIRLACRRYNVDSAGMGLARAPSIPLEIGDFTPYQKRLHLRPYGSFTVTLT
jgi:hypothetical protein